MRNEQEMYNLILKVAKENELIRAVYINGSRANPRVKKDIFQDYDIVYVVREIKPFIQNEAWIKVFGELIIKQEPDRLDMMQEKNVDFSKGYTYLMQFQDGNRIDLHLETVEAMKEAYGTDKLTVPLLDKDNCLPQIPMASDEDYWIKKPTYGRYYSCCNNFWWVAPYCAKGLWRNEILYSIDILNSYVRKELLRMLSWKVGRETGFKLSIGKSYKYLKEYVNDDIWEQLLETFDTKDYESTWKALIITCELFEKTALEVGLYFGYEYNHEEARKSFDFIKYIRELPIDAKDIY